MEKEKALGDENVAVETTEMRHRKLMAMADGFDKQIYLMYCAGMDFAELEIASRGGVE